MGLINTPLRKLLTEYKEYNNNSLYRPVAVGKYGIRTRESIYKKELAQDYSKNKVIFKDTLTVGMGSNQIDIGILSNDARYSVSPVYHTFLIEGVNSDYLRYCLECRNQDMTKRFLIPSARQGKTIDFNRWLEYEVPVCDEQQQLDIVLKLDTINKAISKLKQITILHEEMIKARFIEMFGDPIDNPHSWVHKPLLSLGDCKNGMNFSNDEQGVDIHCLGVGDFKNLSIIDDVTQLPTVSLNCKPSTEYLLKDGDIVFVRSNGNKALVGRSIAIYPKETSTTFSGFCIRFRKKSEEINTYYLLQVFKTESIRRKMAGRGANIQNLNQQILASLDIPIPPIELQNDYESFVKLIEKLKLCIQKEIDLYNELLEKKMNEYFS